MHFVTRLLLGPFFAPPEDVETGAPEGRRKGRRRALSRTVEEASPEGRASSRREFCRAGGAPGAGGRRPAAGRGARPPPGRRAAGDEGDEERAPEGPSSGCKQSLARTRGHISACSRPRVSLYILVYPYIKVLAKIVFTLFTSVRISLVINKLQCNKMRKQMCFKRRLCLQPHAPLV